MYIPVLVGVMHSFCVSVCIYCRIFNINSSCCVAQFDLPVKPDFKVAAVLKGRIFQPLTLSIGQ